MNGYQSDSQSAVVQGSAGVSLYTLPAASPPGHYKTINDSVVLVNQPG